MRGRDAPPVDLGALGDGNASTFLYGASRPVVNRLLYALARSVDPEPIWLDLAPLSAAGEDEPGPVELGWIPSHRLFRAWKAHEALPQRPVEPTALASVVVADDRSGSVERLTDFLRLAPIAQELISRMPPPDGSRRALVVANSDRVRDGYPRTAEGVRPFLSALVEAALYPVVGAQGTPTPARMAFGFVFEARAEDLLHWRDGVLVPEKAPVGSIVRRGVAIPFRDVPAIREAFEARTPPRQSP